ncbi:MAG: hypothetical protein ACJ789_15950 [Thermomicrobiales bacterium]
MHSETPPIVDVIVAAGWDELAAATAAVSPFLPALKGEGTGQLTIALGDSRIAQQRQSLIDWCVDEIGSTYASHEIIAPTRLAVTGWVRSSRTRDPWAAVDVGARSDRLEVAWIRRELVEAATLIALNDVVSGKMSEPLVLGLWAMFAHPRQRLGALAGDDRTGLRAELAVAVRPKLTMLAGESRERPLMIASEDQLAAELTGRGLQSLSQSDPYGELVGPWELPLVQRATELDLGVKLPSQLAIHAVWAGEPGEPGERLHDATVDQIRLALGAPQI